MALYLDEQTRPYLERLIKKAVEKSDKDFIAKRLQGMLKTDQARLDDIANCEHKYGEYVGKEQRCMKCGTHDVGMGTEWKLDKELTEDEIKDMANLQT